MASEARTFSCFALTASFVVLNAIFYLPAAFVMLTTASDKGFFGQLLSAMLDFYIGPNRKGDEVSLTGLMGGLVITPIGAAFAGAVLCRLQGGAISSLILRFVGVVVVFVAVDNVMGYLSRDPLFAPTWMIAQIGGVLLSLIIVELYTMALRLS